MRPVSDKEMDDFFKASFKGFEKAPAPDNWQKIEQHLQPKKSRRFLATYWMAAASIVLIAAFAVKVYHAESETIKLIGVENAIETAQPQVPVAAHHVQNEKPDLEIQSLEELRAANEQRFLTMLASSPKQVDNKSHFAIAKVAEDKLFDNRVTANSQEVLQQEKLNQEITEELVPNKKESLVATAHKVAYRPEAKTEELRAEKIRSIKDVVNFLVSKIDKRKNKIVYMSKTEESDIEITAINLGLFKYRKEY